VNAKSKVIVIKVNEAPKMNNPVMVSGVRDAAAAQTWGEKNGHKVVYYLAKKQRVYAERLLVRVDEKAQEIEQASKELLSMAEGAR
jgi:hypothetical protein